MLVIPRNEGSVVAAKEKNEEKRRLGPLALADRLTANPIRSFQDDKARGCTLA